MSYLGKLRLYVHKFDEVPKGCNRYFEWSEEFDVFEDRLVSEIADGYETDMISYELLNNGHYTLEPSLTLVLEHYAVGDVVEVVGDVHITDTSSNGPDGYEYDYQVDYIETKHRKLSPIEIYHHCRDLSDPVDLKRIQKEKRAEARRRKKAFYL